MRNPEAFQFELLIDDKLRSKVGVEEFPVDRPQALQSEWLASFGGSMDGSLKLRKHRLPYNGRPYRVDLTHQNRRTFFGRCGALEEQSGEQLLVERAGHLCHKNRVAGLLIGARLSRHSRVHRMACLVGEREDVLDRLFLKVHEDVGIGVVGARTKCPRILARIGIAIAPTAREPLLQTGAIALPKWRERFDHEANAFVPRVPVLEFGHQRHVAIIMVDRIQPHDAPPQIVVAVNGREIFSNSSD